MNDNGKTPRQIASILWNAKEILRNDYRLSQYRYVILPFVVLKRLDAVLSPKKTIMLKESKRLGKKQKTLLQNRIKDLTGLDFYNISEYDLSSLIADPDFIHKNLKDYMDSFSDNVQGIFRRFDFQTYMNKLKEQNLLYKVVKYFAEAPLDAKNVDNHKMGTIYEMLIQTSSEASNEEAGDHYTPREVIRLMVNLIFENEEDVLSKMHVIRRLYDPAAGTGGMLSISEEFIREKFPGVNLEVYGQEINDMTYAICKSDMLLKGIDPDTIKFGNSLTKSDGFQNEQFDYMLSNPPFGVDWKKYEEEIDTEAKKGDKARYGAGLPRTTDGSLLFLMHMISKIKKTESGTRLAIVFNGSPLFTGEAGQQNENGIRKWIIENDWLEAIIALPKNLFFNTGIQTYIWILSNRKPDQRKNKSQLINAESFSDKMKKNVGEKRNEITTEQIEEITKIYKDFEENEYCKIFDNKDFGYIRITIERPLKRNFQNSAERLERLKRELTSQNLEKVKPKEPQREDVLKIVESMHTKLYKDHSEFVQDLKAAFLKANFNLNSSLQKALENSLSERDETAKPTFDKDGNMIPDVELRDYENVPLKENIDRYFEREVKPYVPDAWIDDSSTEKIGYEIPFTRHFYKYKPLRLLKDIDEEMRRLQKEISQELEKLMIV
jgi:type I restriction enzyme M protein